MGLGKGTVEREGVGMRWVNTFDRDIKVGWSQGYNARKVQRRLKALNFDNIDNSHNSFL